MLMFHAYSTKDILVKTSRGAPDSDFEQNTKQILAKKPTRGASGFELPEQNTKGILMEKPAMERRIPTS